MQAFFVYLCTNYQENRQFLAILSNQKVLLAD